MAEPQSDMPDWVEALRSGFDTDDEGNLKIPRDAHAAFLAAVTYAVSQIDTELFLYSLEYALDDPARNMPFLLLEDEQALHRLHGELRVLVQLWQTKLDELQS